MKELFSEILFRPLINLVVILYNAIPGGDFGVAIIVLTFLIRMAFLPLSLKTLRSQKALNMLQPKVQEVKQKFKDDHTAQSQAVMQLYKDHKVNPLGGCLPLLIQIPVLIALYQVFLAVSKSQNFDLLYGFVSNPGEISKTFLGLVDITVRNPFLALLAGGLQFVQARMSAPAGPSSPGDQMGALSKQMLYFFPVMIIIISWNLPAGLTLYWVATTAFSIFEQMYIKRTGLKTRSA